MKKPIIKNTAIISFFILFCSLTEVAFAKDKIIVNDGYVRINTESAAINVGGDWRTGSNISITDTESILVELGAVQKEDYIHVNLAGDVLFEFASTKLSDPAKDMLFKVAQIIRKKALGEVLIVGHTDSVGEIDANQTLSEARSVAVIRWLQQKEGIPVAILVAQGKGELQPIADNISSDGQDNPVGRALNRRVELYLGTTKHADVRAAANLLSIKSSTSSVGVTNNSVNVGNNININKGEVQIGDGIKISNGGVQIGNSVKIDSSGVQVGQGIQISGAVVDLVNNEDDNESLSCLAGENCKANCADGDCQMSCSTDAKCNFSCAGGDCAMQCSTGATCNFSCTGGDCNFDCAEGSKCKTSCSGDGCVDG